MKKVLTLGLLILIATSLANCGGSAAKNKSAEIEGPLVMFGKNVHNQSDATTVISAIKKIDTKKEIENGFCIVMTLEDDNYYEVFVPEGLIESDYYGIDDVFNKKFVVEALLSDKYESYMLAEGADNISGSEKDRRFPMDYCLIDKSKLYKAEKWFEKNKSQAAPNPETITARIVHTVPVYRPADHPLVTSIVYTSAGDRLYIMPYDMLGLGSEVFDLSGSTIEYVKLNDGEANIINIEENY